MRGVCPAVIERARSSVRRACVVAACNARSPRYPRSHPRKSLMKIAGRSLLLCVAACVAAYRPAPRALRRAPACAMQLHDDEASECLLLQYTPFKGTAPQLIGGEMELQEFEDSEETRSQIFLNADGTVAIGATDGPPAVDICGLWQCGSEGFQMTLRRTFSTEPSVLPMTTGAKPLRGPITYSVTRVYVGSVDANSQGVKAVEGKIVPFDDSAPDTSPPAVGAHWHSFDFGAHWHAPSLLF